MLSPEIKRAIDGPAMDDASLSDQRIGHLAQSFPERIRMLHRAKDRRISLYCRHTASESRRTTRGRSQTQTVGVARQDDDLPWRLNPLMGHQSKDIVLQSVTSVFA
jgi:hypothetical protein